MKFFDQPVFHLVDVPARYLGSRSDIEPLIFQETGLLVVEYFRLFFSINWKCTTEGSKPIDWASGMTISSC